MDTSVAFIIPAAGTGSRMGQSTPKPFIRVGDKPILYWTIKKILPTRGLKSIIVPTQKEYFEEVEGIFNEIRKTQNSNLRLKVVEGGAERQFSIQYALSELEDEVLVAVHDAVRINPDLSAIHIALDKADKIGGAVVGVPSRDTIKIVDPNTNIVTSTPPRNTLWICHTPQIFKAQTLINAYKYAFENNFLGTDDASVVEYFGELVVMVEGNVDNVKITFPEDLEWAETIVNRIQSNG